MRTAIAVCWLLLAHSVPAVVKVERVVPIECSRHVLLSALLDGKPVGAVKIDLYDGTKDSSLAVYAGSTNEDGIATLPDLALGTYRVDATYHERTVTLVTDEIRDMVWLKVVSKSGVSKVSIDLTNARNDAHGFEKQFANRLSEAEQGPHALVTVLLGTVVDPSGTPVSAVAITVFDKHPDGWSRMLSSASDAKGKFSITGIGRGKHVAVFSAPGFRLAMVPFEIADTAAGNLRVKLKLGFTDVGIPRDSSRIATTDNWQLTTNPDN